VEAENKAAELNEEYSKLRLKDLVGKIEEKFTEEESLDSMGDDPGAVLILKGWKEEIEKANESVEAPDKVTYPYIVDALERFIIEDYTGL
jgi:hypothetical protein